MSHPPCKGFSHFAGEKKPEEYKSDEHEHKHANQYEWHKED
jgi:hypothetical protein